MSLRTAFALCISMQASAAFAAISYPSIISGEKVLAEEGIAGAVVALRHPMGSCTGTLVNSTTVVTAAHCPDLAGKDGIRVIHQGGVAGFCKTATVIEIAYAPGARFDSVNGYHQPDIAMLKLGTPICDANPAALYSGNVDEYTKLNASGYGKGTTPGPLPDRLRIDLIDRSTIAENYYDDLDPNVPEEAALLTDLQGLVAGGDDYLIAQPTRAGQSLCSGDSGGPTYVEGRYGAELVGVNGAIYPHPKKGVSSCHFAFLQLFTPVAPYSYWIESTAASWE